MRAYPESIIVDTGSEIFVYEKSRTETELVQEHFIGLPYPRNIYLLPLSLSAIQNIHLFHDGPVSMQYQKCFFTDLAEIPLFSHPALTTLLDKMKNNVEETRNVSGAKHPFYTYGMPGITPHRTLRSTLGSIYDSYYEKFTRTFLGRILRKKYVTSKL